MQTRRSRRSCQTPQHMNESRWSACKKAQHMQHTSHLRQNDALDTITASSREVFAAVYSPTYLTVVVDGSPCRSVCLSEAVSLSFCLLPSGPSPHFSGPQSYCCPNNPFSQKPKKSFGVGWWGGCEYTVWINYPNSSIWPPIKTLRWKIVTFIFVYTSLSWIWRR